MTQAQGHYLVDVNAQDLNGSLRTLCYISSKSAFQVSAGLEFLYNREDYGIERRK